MAKAIEFCKVKKDYFAGGDARGPWEIPCSFAEVVKRFKWMPVQTQLMAEVMFRKYEGLTPPWSDQVIQSQEDTSGVCFKLSPWLLRELTEVLENGCGSDFDEQDHEFMEALRLYSIPDPDWDYGISWDI